MTGHPRWNGGAAQAPPISPRVYVCCVLVQLLFLGSALLTRHRDVGHVLPGLLRAGASLMGVGFALTLGVDRGQYLLRKPPPSRLAWVWVALSVLCTLIAPLLLMH
jgi:drug/metabolite transporter (DMT)-like permease